MRPYPKSDRRGVLESNSDRLYIGLRMILGYSLQLGTNILGTVGLWNSIPDSVVSALFINTFRARLDEFPGKAL